MKMAPFRQEKKSDGIVTLIIKNKYLMLRIISKKVDKTVELEIFSRPFRGIA
jgi:hypothetical protein